MKSLAIWYEYNSSFNSDYEIDLHFNHWKIKIDNPVKYWVGSIFRARKFQAYRKSEYLLDFGFKINSNVGIRNFCLFLPEEYDAKEIPFVLEDLGDKLSDKGLLTAVFNEKYDPRPVNGKKHFEVIKGNTTIFNIYAIDVKNEVTSEKKFGGTIIRIPIYFFNNLSTYYRVRLKSDFVQKFSRVYRPNNSFLESAFSSMELIDFRVNDTRNLDLSLLQHIDQNGKYFKINLIHFFIMRDLTDEHIISDIKLNSIRQLEKDTWNNYFVNTKNKFKNTIAYHLKLKSETISDGSKKYIEDYNALIKFRFQDSKLFWYIIYLVVFALAFEVIGGFLSDYLKDDFPNWLNTNWPTLYKKFYT